MGTSHSKYKKSNKALYQQNQPGWGEVQSYGTTPGGYGTTTTPGGYGMGGANAGPYGAAPTTGFASPYGAAPTTGFAAPYEGGGTRAYQSTSPGAYSPMGGYANFGTGVSGRSYSDLSMAGGTGGSAYMRETAPETRLGEDVYYYEQPMSYGGGGVSAFGPGYVQEPPLRYNPSGGYGLGDYYNPYGTSAAAAPMTWSSPSNISAIHHPSSVRGSWNKAMGSMQSGVGKMFKSRDMMDRGVARKASGEAQTAMARGRGLPYGPTTYSTTGYATPQTRVVEEPIGLRGAGYGAGTAAPMRTELPSERYVSEPLGRGGLSSAELGGPTEWSSAAPMRMEEYGSESNVMPASGGIGSSSRRYELVQGKPELWEQPEATISRSQGYEGGGGGFESGGGGSYLDVQPASTSRAVQQQQQLQPQQQQESYSRPSAGTNRFEEAAEEGGRRGGGDEEVIESLVYAEYTATATTT